MATANHTDAIDSCAAIIFEFEHADDELVESDGIVAFGNHDIHVAERAAELYLEGTGSFVLFTGGFGRITKEIWGETEAENLSKRALELGVPEAAVLVEGKSTNTGENISLSKKLLAEKDLLSDRLIMVERPYRQLRIRAALEVQWPETSFLMASPELTYREYCEWYGTTGPISKESFISLLVGDLQRIIVYGEKGFQSPQHIPDDVMEAYRTLIELGFTSQMIT